ncbi:MAG TPA: hypothetical protein PKZ16_01795 [bacterium]|nr:hypothetical protein [bacterium]HPL95512.1 hypothetical protein [bacterium]
MNLSKHLVVNIATGVIFYRFGVINSLKFYLLFIIFGILIDVDHVIYLIFKEKTSNFKKLLVAGKNERKKMQAHLYIFHSPEFNFVLAILSFFNQIILLIFLSNMIHLILDIVEHYHFHKDFRWFKQWSVIYHVSK